MLNTSSLALFILGHIPAITLYSYFITGQHRASRTIKHTNFLETSMHGLSIPAQSRKTPCVHGPPLCSRPSHGIHHHVPHRYRSTLFPSYSSFAHVFLPLASLSPHAATWQIAYTLAALDMNVIRS
ncbi:hypothetical protein J3458_012326 [Metarhizium acridum]|uniref:uncharacterized protein n=1 Tax=Metarhizium acridum TaxID=92637 RepID=UPI001C6B56E1|nr:hypothetical protein J3458_012326 [Metarhizium acridum]